MRDPTLLSRIEPQPPKGISYMLGGETWKPADQRSPIRLVVEEWGNLGPMELDPTITQNSAGFRVRNTVIVAPPGALGFSRELDGVYWTASTALGGAAKEG